MVLGPRLVFAEPCERDCTDGAALVAAAFRRAQRGKRPLLVVVIPEDGKKHDRGRAFGELLNHGGDAHLAPFGAAEVVCATLEDLRRIVPAVPSGRPVAVVVTPHTTPIGVQLVDAALEEGERDGEDDLADQRIAILGGAIRRALRVPAADVKRLAAEAREAVVKKPPPGARWASGSGCGERVEGDDHPLMVKCGMGHVPAKSRRFLYLWAKLPSERYR